jgi:hypothetical protein
MIEDPTRPLSFVLCPLSSTLVPLSYLDLEKIVKCSDRSGGKESPTVLRISPIFILLFVAAAVIAAFGIHKYLQQAQNSEKRSVSSEALGSTGETIENIPGDWSTRNGSDDLQCKSWTADGTCLSETE